MLFLSQVSNQHSSLWSVGQQGSKSQRTLCPQQSSSPFQNLLASALWVLEVGRLADVRRGEMQERRTPDAAALTSRVKAPTTFGLAYSPRGTSCPACGLGII